MNDYWYTPSADTLDLGQFVANADFSLGGDTLPLELSTPNLTANYSSPTSMLQSIPQSSGISLSGALNSAFATADSLIGLYSKVNSISNQAATAQYQRTLAEAQLDTQKTTSLGQLELQKAQITGSQAVEKARIAATVANEQAKVASGGGGTLSTGGMSLVSIAIIGGLFYMATKGKK